MDSIKDSIDINFLQNNIKIESSKKVNQEKKLKIFFNSFHTLFNKSYCKNKKNRTLINKSKKARILLTKKIASNFTKKKFNKESFQPFYSIVSFFTKEMIKLENKLEYISEENKSFYLEKFYITIDQLCKIYINEIESKNTLSFKCSSLPIQLDLTKTSLEITVKENNKPFKYFIDYKNYELLLNNNQIRKIEMESLINFIKIISDKFKANEFVMEN